jgi:hypothetical protein
MLPALLLLLAFQAPPACPDAAACRVEAESAAARGDYETFHDLAWRAVQKGKPNDPALLFLLARAQALSGRPGDALVMLGRLADMHVPLDLSHADLERVRHLPGWSELAARVDGAPPPLAPEGVATPPAPSSASPPSAAAPLSAAPSSAASSSAAALSASAPAAGGELAFDAPSNLQAFGLAHDAVSRRFVIGDAASRRLLIVDEVSRHLVPYVSAASAGFFDELTALSLDARRGDLWVTSTKGSGAGASSILHKLQLVSGRGLTEVRPAASLGAVRLVDVAVAPDGTVLALDAAGGRVLRLRPDSRTLEMAVRLEADGLTALAAFDDHTVFIASAAGLLHADLASRAVQAIKSVEDLRGFVSLDWRNGAVVGVQHVNGASLVVRLALEAGGTRARPRAILAASPSAIVGSVGDSAFYYLLDGAIHRVALR